MIYAVAITETLRRVVFLEKPALEDAIDCVMEAYQDGRIVLGADDVVQDACTGLNAVIEHAEWEEARIGKETGGRFL